MAADNNEQPIEQAQGLLLTGEGLSAMTPDQLQVLSKMVGGLGLRVTVVGSLEGLGVQAEAEPEPVPGSVGIVVAFAVQHGYTTRRAHKALWSVQRTAQHYTKCPDAFPSLRFIGSTVDLRSVYERLVASSMGIEAWIGATKPTVGFLAHIVNEKLHPEEPLPFEPPG